MQLFRSKPKPERQFDARRFKLPSEEFFRTAIAVSAIAIASMFVAGNYGTARESGIKQKGHYASISQITDYASRHPLKTTLFLFVDVAVLAAFSLAYYGSIVDHAKRGVYSD
jgi:hypothetical protein